MSSLTLLLTALAATSLVFGAVFVLARRIRNFGIVDIAWAAGFAPVAVVYAVVAEGWTARRALIAGMVALWSLRLAVHLGRRVIGHHPEEDVRYARLRRDWADAVNPKMALFFQAQAWLLTLLTVPFLLATRDTTAAWRIGEITATALWVVALVGEAIADRQLSRFRANPANRGRVCEDGLWRLSRHPNYFFEWLVWVAFALFAAGAPWGWTGFLAPALMLWFLVRVTGIRYTEEQSLRSKGEAYRAYQQRTSGFVPWFPRKSRPSSPPLL